MLRGDKKWGDELRAYIWATTRKKGKELVRWDSDDTRIPGKQNGGQDKGGLNEGRGASRRAHVWMGRETVRTPRHVEGVTIGIGDLERTKGRMQTGKGIDG